VSTTESSSPYQRLEKMSVRMILNNINREDQTVPGSIKKVIPDIEALVRVIVRKMKKGGRLFYIGAGTSGRLGVVDASEIPPTYGVRQGLVIALMAGGDGAIRRAVEHAEDDFAKAWVDLKEYKISSRDVLVGIAASGTTPYVIGGLRDANAHGVVTGCITCNKGTALARVAKYPIEAIVGPEVVTGSTRMKAGTAQKLVLNMISTSVMIRLGRVKGNKMVDMQLTNNKLIARGTRMLMEELGLSPAAAEALLKKYGNVRKALARAR
jgi:N-acetylmuramic acid 6-phosphate etherase